MGDLGVMAEESYGLDMNNKAEVVGHSLAYLVYKNDIYKQVHAVKWVNGQAIDLHNEVPKSVKTSAIAINDLSDVLIHVGETKEYLPKYLICNDKKVTDFSYNLNKINNIGYVYNLDYNYGQPVAQGHSVVYDRNSHMICISKSIQDQIQNESNSIWMKIIKFLQVNTKGEIIAQGETIYGEQHAMLLTPVASQ